MVVQAKGYVTDVPYVRVFIRESAPAWLDYVAIVSGLAPPARGFGFAWCDLGCGQGVTAAMLAAMHPAGQFHAIDAMPEHVDHGRRFAAEGGIANISFHAADFAAAAELDFPKFNYIVVYGVYSWVSRQIRTDIRSFIDRHLSPGGLIYISYNAMPGRAADLPFQRLVRALGETCAGDSGERVTAALKIVDSFLELKAPALLASRMLSLLKQQKERFATGYLAHEYMGQHWDPLFVTEVRSDMASIGLEPIGSARLAENHDTFVLGQTAREALAAISDDDVRELARDFLIDHGNAAGNTLEEAILQGFFELVERDAVAIWWYNRLRKPGVAVETFGEPYLLELAEHYRQHYRRVTWALDVTSDLGIPVFVAASKMMEGKEEKLLFGLGCHLDARIALQRAFAEMNQMLGMARTGEGGELLLEDSETLEWLRHATVANQPYMAADPDQPLKRFSDYPMQHSSEFLQDINHCRSIIEAQGMEMLVLDQTRADVGMPVVKVVVPGLRHFWARFAPGRLYDVPVKMGWLEKPLREDELNPIPIFV